MIVAPKGINPRMAIAVREVGIRVWEVRVPVTERL